MIKNLLTTLFGLLFGLILFAIGLIAVAVLVTYPKLPELSQVQNYQPKEPLTIYSSDNVIIGTYGDERRAFTTINLFPENLKNAVIAAEDKRFREHWGVDLIGIARAVIGNLQSGGVQSGASTITQQVARNFYLTNERTLTRKFNEALLAYKIERTLTKDQILELYFNQIYLGQRAYGFASAAKIYFNKDVNDLTLAEASILAGLPKAPSAFNPIVNPERARLRQEYILNNMLELGMITPAQHQEALAEKLHYERHRIDINQDSLYVAEMARQDLYARYGEDAYTRGFKVYTTVDSKQQAAATRALRSALRSFDRGSTYRGAEQQLDLSHVAEENMEAEIEQFLSNTYTVEGLIPAIITQASNKNGITFYMAGGKKASISAGRLGAARNFINSEKAGDTALKVGSMIRVSKSGNGWVITQQPEIQGALVSIDAETGAIRAMVGGYDFHYKSFNRATQGIRQPGSTFKPFVYSAFLAKGYNAETMVEDAPLNIAGWQPKNSDGNYAGMITLRSALTRSKNTVSVRILQTMGVRYARDYIAQNFGFKPDQIPTTLSLALGAGQATPLQMAEGYAVFANGGYKIATHILDKIYDSKDNLVAQMKPLVAGQNATRVIAAGNAATMNSILRDVVQRGTARAALSLNRRDIAGKTGTTNDFKDAWFIGYTPKIVTAVYVGYDKPRSMGRRGFGGTLALPIWINYMRFALNGVKQRDFAGISAVPTPSNADTEEIVNETALEGDAPVGVTNTPAAPQNSNTETPAPAPESTGNRRNNSGSNRNTGAAPATDDGMNDLF